MVALGLIKSLQGKTLQWYRLSPAVHPHSVLYRGFEALPAFPPIRGSHRSVWEGEAAAMGKVTKTSKTFAKKHLQSTISRRKTVQKVKRTRAGQEQKRGAPRHHACRLGRCANADQTAPNGAASRHAYTSSRRCRAGASQRPRPVTADAALLPAAAHLSCACLCTRAQPPSGRPRLDRARMRARRPRRLWRT
jgi:hypothetical protein